MIVANRKTITANYIELGKLFKQVRDEKIYKTLGHDTMASFVADGSISFSQSRVRQLIHTYELFIEKLKMNPDDLSLVSSGRLVIISPVVSGDPDEWMAKAVVLSRSDLINEVREAQGKAPMLPAVVPEVAELRGIYTPQQYADLVTAQACLECGARPPSMKAHFPVTKGAGAVEFWVIPLCNTCHSEYHLDPLAWARTYQRKWAGWFYGLLTGGVTP